MCFRLLTAAAFAFAAGAAAAEPTMFTFSSVVGGNGTTVEGTAVGQTFEIVVVADNGSSSVTSGSWDHEHHVLTTVKIGDAFVLEQSGAVVFEATTDDTGSVTSINLFTDPQDGVGPLSGGSFAITVNGARNIVIDGDQVVDAEDLTTAANWTAAAP